MRFSLLAAVVIAAQPLAAQHAPHAFRAGLTVGVVGPSTVLSEGSGVEVRTTTGPFIGAEVQRAVGETRALGVYGRLSSAPVSLRVGGASYGAKTSMLTVIGVRASQRLAQRLSVRGGVGATYVHGPSDVRPFSSGTHVHPSVDLALSLGLDARAHWSIDVGGAGYRVGTSDAVQRAGTVAGVLLGVNRAF